MEINTNDYKISIGRVILDSELKPYKLVIRVDFVNDNKLILKGLRLGEIKNSITCKVIDYLKGSQCIKKLGIEPDLISYFNSEIEVSNNRILYSFLVRDTKGYKDWIDGKDIIWYSESEVDKYDNV